MVAAPSRLVAYTLTVLIGQIVHRRLTTDDGITAAGAADFIVSLVMTGLRPDKTPWAGYGTITAECSGIIDVVSTSLGEASTRI
jgi:hypothetical protein